MAGTGKGADEGEPGAYELLATRCKQWNADRDHQRMAGKIRAQAFTSTYQAAAAHAQQTQFSAQWRAEQGLPPLSAEAVRRYLTPEMIRGPLGRPLDAVLQVRIYRAWCAGYLYGVPLWLNQPTWGDVLEAALDRAEQGMTQPPLLDVPDEFAQAWVPRAEGGGDDAAHR
jgi:hypothetical protein